MTRLVKLLLCSFLLVPTLLWANAEWPFPEGVRPLVSASTWQNNNNDLQIDVSNNSSILGGLGNNNNELGYKANRTDFSNNHNNACGNDSCVANSDYLLPANRNQIQFSPPNNTPRILVGGGTTNINVAGTYRLSNDSTLTGTLNINAPVTLYANKFKVDGGSINVASGNADDFVMVLRSDVEFIDAGTIAGHAVSRDYLHLNNTTLTGSVVTHDFKLDSGGELGGQTPQPPGNLTCSFNGNQDFYVELDITGSTQYQEVYLTNNSQNQRYQTLWYSQDPPPSPPNNYPAEFLILDETLSDGVDYNLRFEYQSGQGNDPGTLYYYKKLSSDAQFTFIKEMSATIKNGSVVATGSGYDNVECDNVPITPPSTLPPICDVFPYAAQSWIGAPTSTISFGGGSYLIGSYQRSGDLGFETVNRNWPEQTACDGVSCNAASGLAIDEPAIYPLTIPADPPVIDPSAPLTAGSYSEISLGSGGSYRFEGGVYHIGRLTLNGGATLRVPSSTTLIVNQLSFGGGASFYVEGDDLITIWAENGTIGDASVSIATNANMEIKANIFSRKTVTISGSGVVQGAITADQVTLSGSGSINDINNSCNQPPSSADLELSPKRAISLTCETGPVLDFQLLNSTSNTDTIIVEFSGSSSYSSSVIPGSGSGPSNGNRYQANSSGLLQIGLSDNTVGTVSVYTYIEGQESATNQSGSYKFVPNKFAITDAVQSVIANQASDIQIQAMQCNASGDPVAIPADEYSGEQTLSISTTIYDEPSSDNVRVTEAVVVQDKDDNWVAAPSSSLTLSFSSAGIANTKVRYTEAGTISYNLSDQVCITNEAGEQECEEIVGLQQLDARPWTFAICHDSKTLAGTSKSGVTADDALVEAGSSFDLLLHPLRYVDDEPDPSVISVGTYCDELRTENFFSSDAPLASVTIDSSNVALHTPENGSLGTGLEGLTTLTNRGVTELRMSGLSWKDVGSLTVQTQGAFLGTVKPGTRSIGRFYPAYLSLNDETNHPSEHSSFAYLGQPLDHKFWVYAHESGGDPVSNYHLFNETFASKVSYIARSNSVEDLTDRLYDGSTKIATEYALGQGELGMVGGTDPDAQLAVEFTKFEFVRAPIGATTTTPEEPFTNTNTDFGLDVSTVVDDATWQVPIELTTNIKQFNPFIDDYDYRYGRMVLRDVGGNSGATIQVPLQVEFLSGGKFIINEDDGNSTLLGSDYNGAYFCSQRIWPGDSDPIAELDGKGAVVSGVAVKQTGPDSEFLFATHNNTSAREQTRLWLRIGAIAPQEIDSDPIVDCSRSSSPGNYTNRPWLKYDWRSIGDEDPSVVVTFGTHRGNDRIIYRGEPNLAGN